MKISGSAASCLSELIKSLPSITSFFELIIIFAKYLLLNTFEHSSKATSRFVPEANSNSIVLENFSSSEFNRKLPRNGNSSIFLCALILLFKVFV